MIFILHGTNVIRSRNALVGLKTKLSLDKIEVDITEVAPGALLDMLSSFDIFGKPPFIVLDISNAGRMRLEPYVAVATKVPSNAVLVVVADKKLGVTNPFIKSAKALGAKVILSEAVLESNVFKFVDDLFSGKRGACYKELQQLMLEEEDPFRIFSMILYGLRNIALVKFSSPESTKLRAFVARKSAYQAMNFSKESLVTLFKKFYEMDRDVKSGGLPTNLLVSLAVEAVLKYV